MAKHDDFWDDDFDEADVEATLLKASQVCPLPNIDAGTSGAAANYAERQEIKELMQDPNLFGGPNQLDVDSLPDIAAMDYSTKMKVKKSERLEVNYDELFDAFDDNIDPDFLQSQPIPGTQPRQRWMHGDASNKNLNMPSIGTSNKKPVNLSTGGTANDIALGSKIAKANTLVRLKSREGVEFAHAEALVKPDSVASAISASSSLMKPPQFPIVTAPGSLQSYGIHCESSISSHKEHVKSNQPVAQANRSFVSTSTRHTTSHSTATSSQINICNKTQHTVNDFSAISAEDEVYAESGKALTNEHESKQKLVQYQREITELQRDIMTKRGEVSCLRCELQRRTVALDAERMARVAAQEMHKKEVQEKVAAATREAQSKSRALEIRLEKLHGDMAFKNREITELVTKCKKLEQQHQQQLKRHQLQLSQQHVYASSQEPVQTQPPPPPPPPLPPELVGVEPRYSSSKRFPASRFDFGSKGPSASSRDVQHPAQQQWQEGASVHPNTSDGALAPVEAEQDVQYMEVEQVEGVPLYLRLGMYKPSLESIAILNSLSRCEAGMSHATELSSRDSTSPPPKSGLLPLASRRQEPVITSVASSAEAVCSDPLFHAAKALATHRAESYLPLDLTTPFTYTSIVLSGHGDDEGDKLCSWDDDEHYRDDDSCVVSSCDDVGNEYSKDYARGVKQEKTSIKQEITQMQCDTSENKGVNGNNFDLVTPVRIGYGDKLLECYSTLKLLRDPNTSESVKTQLLLDGLQFKWTDDDVAALIAKDINRSSGDADCRYSDADDGAHVEKCGGDLEKSLGSKDDLKGEASSAAGCVEHVPQEWMRLLSRMAQDDGVYKIESTVDGELLEDVEMNEAEGSNSSSPEKNNKSSADTDKSRGARLPKIGGFLFDLTQELLEDNIRNLNGDCNGNVNTVDATKKELNVRSNENKATGTGDSYKDNEDEMFFEFNFALYEGESRRKHRSDDFKNSDNPTLDLFHNILEWLSEEATYYRNVSRNLTVRRTEGARDRHLRLQKTAITVLEQLLPLRLGCGPLPPPIVVLAYLLHPMDLDIELRRTHAPAILRCLCAASSHPSTVLTPELALVLTTRLCRCCRDGDCDGAGEVDTPAQLTALLRCCAALSGQHRTFVQTVCSVAEECLVWRVCVTLLNLCHQPYSDNCGSTSLSGGKGFTATVRRGAMVSEDGVSSSIRAFLLWTLTVLKAKPAWLYGECQCTVVLLMTLLVITHDEVYHLVRALPMVRELQLVLCSDHQHDSISFTLPCTWPTTPGHKTSNSSVSATVLDGYKNVSVGTTLANQTTLGNVTVGSSVLDKTPMNVPAGNTFSNETILHAGSSSNTRNRFVTSTRISSCGSINDKPAVPSNIRRSGSEVVGKSSAPSHATTIHDLHQCTTTLPYHQCSSTVAALVGCRCPLLLACLRTFRRYMSVGDSRCFLHMASVPHYTLLCRALQEVAPWYPDLVEAEAGKLLRPP